MNDPTLIKAALAAAGLTSRRLASDVLDMDEGTVRQWLRGSRPVQNAARVVCAAIVERPQLAAELAHARASLHQHIPGRSLTANEDSPASAVDESPFKITRDDVSRIRLIAAEIRRGMSYGPDAVDLERFADKIAALLPEESAS